ncbi:hypothetical protein Bca4012_084454 [Brassica carinata]
MMGSLSLFSLLPPSESERPRQAGRICYRCLTPDARATTLATGGSDSTVLAGFRLRSGLVGFDFLRDDDDAVGY